MLTFIQTISIYAKNHFSSESSRYHKTIFVQTTKKKKKKKKKKTKKKTQKAEKELRSIFSVSCEQYMCKDKKHCLKKPRTYHR